jgi:hypothetical protein
LVIVLSLAVTRLAGLVNLLILSLPAYNVPFAIHNRKKGLLINIRIEGWIIFLCRLD